ncbi:MAG TPA: PKD domain-containing protein, partial [Jiangellaceae bacterium]
MRRRAPKRFKATAGLLAVSALALVAAQIVLAAPPSASFTISDTTPNVGQNITFTSTATDPDGDITTREWDFNFDGSFNVSATGASVSTSYATGGAKTVALRVTDGPGDPTTTPPGDGSVDVDTSVQSFTVTVPNQNPTASFNFAAQPPHNGNRPIPGQQINFNSTASDPDGDALSYEWNFGDGTSSATADPSHSYGTAGTKNVTLTVRDNRGGSVTTPAQQVIVNALPVPNGAVLNSSREPGQKY